MKKLLQLSLLALAGQLAFSCSPAKQHFDYTVRDTNYGYNAPKKAVAVKEAVDAPVITAETMKPVAAPEEATAVVEANAAPVVQAEATTATDAAPAAKPTVTKAAPTKAMQALAAASAITAGKMAAIADKVTLTKKDIKQLKKEIKDRKKTSAVTGNLRLALILLLAAIIAGALTGVHAIGGLMAILATLFGLGALIFFVLWLLNEV